MSADIDMEFYGRTSAPAAGEQSGINSYHQGDQEPFVHQELLDQPIQEPEPVVEKVNPQAENFRALREEVDRIKAERELERREYQLQLDMLRANRNEPQQPPPKQNELFPGMKDEDIFNVGEFKKAWETIERDYTAREQAHKAKIEELQVQQQFPDYAEVMNKYLTPYIQQKPHLVNEILKAENKALFAYEIGKMAQQIEQLKAPPPPAVNPNAQRIVENSRKVGTLSQAGGQGALSKADYYATMSDAEFMKLASRYQESI